jgi:hypothetical protein
MIRVLVDGKPLDTIAQALNVERHEMRGDRSGS